MEKHDFDSFVHCGKVLDHLIKISGELEYIRRVLVACKDSFPDEGEFYDFMRNSLCDMVNEIMALRDSIEKKYCALIDKRNKRYKEICKKDS